MGGMEREGRNGKVCWLPSILANGKVCPMDESTLTLLRAAIQKKNKIDLQPISHPGAASPSPDPVTPE